MAKCHSCMKKVVKHVKDDIHDYKEEIQEDRELLKAIKPKKSAKKAPPKKKHDPKKKHVAKSKVQKVMEEYKKGELHSGSKRGPVVHNKKQAIAIALSEARKARKKK